MGVSVACGSRPPVVRRAVNLSPAGLKTRRLQGQYIGRPRNLKGANRIRVRAVAKKDGVPPAIALADRLLQA